MHTLPGNRYLPLLQRRFYPLQLKYILLAYQAGDKCQYSHQSRMCLAQSDCNWMLLYRVFADGMRSGFFNPPLLNADIDNVGH